MRYFIATLAIVFFSTAAQANPALWRAEGWTQTDFSKSAVPFAEFLSGGPPKDGIPSIDAPKFLPIEKIDDLAEVDPVVEVEINADARAYPLRVLIWHEIVNDVVGGVPVAVTYCPLCNSAVVFERTLEGRLLEFGTTGKLRNSDLVMYDRQTQTWWQQFTGQAIVGALLGAELKIVPARLASYAAFKARHPQGRVLIPNNPNARRYGANPYVGYDTAQKPFLYFGETPKGVEPMARVVVVRPPNAEPLIVTVEHLRKVGALQLGGAHLVWRPGQASALDAREIAKGRDVGGVEVTNANGEPMVHDVTFAFSAHAFHPNTPIIHE